MRDLIASKSTN